MFVGIDIGGTGIKRVLTRESGKVLSYKYLPTPETAEEINQTIYNLIEILATTATISKIDIKAIGIGAAGSIDRSKGIIITCPHIPAWKNYPLSKNIEKITGIKVFLENDATAALIGGWWQGNGNKFSNWIMLTIGTGIGAGVIIDNRIFTGQNGSSMEAGHMTINPSGKECICGNVGCWEKYASATALVEYIEPQINKRNIKTSLKNRIKETPLTAKMIFEEAQNNDDLALDGVNYIAENLGYGIVNLVNMLNPEAIIIGGGLSHGHKLLFPTINKIIKERALAGLKENIKIMPIKDQELIPALGAARLAIDSLKE